MLGRLDKFDWKKLQAENVPIWIRQLASPDEEIRFNARTKLSEQILCEDSNLQGIEINRLNKVLGSGIHTIIIPFLVELLTVKPVEDKEHILGMLHFMAEYIDYFGKDHRLSKEASLIREVVWRDNDVYFLCLNDEKAEVKLEAVRLLSEFTEHAEYILPRLQTFTESPLEKEIKAEAIWEINENLLRDKIIEVNLLSEFSEALERLIKTDQNHVVRITAIVTLVNLLGKATPTKAIDYLVEAMINPMEWTTLASSVRALVIPVQARTLNKLGIQKGIPAAIQVMDKTQSIEICFHTFVAALILGFCAEPIPHNYGIIPSYKTNKPEHYTLTISDDYQVTDFRSCTLNASQEAIIEAAIRNDYIWSVTSNVFNIFGLPDQREELKSWLA